MPVLLMFTFNTADVIGNRMDNFFYRMRTKYKKFCRQNIGSCSILLEPTSTSLDVIITSSFNSSTIVVLCSKKSTHNCWRGTSIHFYSSIGNNKWVIWKSTHNVSSIKNSSQFKRDYREYDDSFIYDWADMWFISRVSFKIFKLKLN